jgi:hypothetical protein
MRLWVIIMLLTTVGLLSFLLGLYVAFYFQNQLQVFGQLGDLIPIFSPIGSIVVILGMIVNWYRQPTLVYDGIYTKKQIYVNTNNPHYNLVYYLRIKKKKGRGRVENCEGRIIFGKMDMMTVWDSGVRYSSISIQDDLRLFENFQSDHSNESHLIFHSNPTQSGIQKTMISYSDGILDKEILVRIGCEGNANLPSKPFIRTIGQIIAQANE